MEELLTSPAKFDAEPAPANNFINCAQNMCPPSFNVFGNFTDVKSMARIIASARLEYDKKELKRSLIRSPTDVNTLMQWYSMYLLPSTPDNDVETDFEETMIRIQQN